MRPRQVLHIVFILIFGSLNGCAQTKTATATKEDRIYQSDSLFSYTGFIPGSYVQMEVDILDNVYLLTNGYQLKKFNANGDSIAVFNDVKRFGNPSYIDVSNPFKVLVYYKNFSTAVILDRLLAQRNTINFRKQDIFMVKAITTSYDNNIWLFDEQDFKLKKINDDGKVLQESSDMRVLVDTVPAPTQIIDSDNFVYLYDPKKGFYVFDYYGALKNNLPFKGWSSVSVSKKMVYGFHEQNLYTYDTQTLQLKKYPLSGNFAAAEGIRAMNGKVYLLLKEGIVIYTVK